jgi:hypothetical protein
MSKVFATSSAKLEDTRAALTLSSSRRVEDSLRYLERNVCEPSILLVLRKQTAALDDCADADRQAALGEHQGGSTVNSDLPDYNAPRPVDARAQAMKPFFDGSSAARVAFASVRWIAEEAVEYAREQVAKLIGATA